MNIYRARFSKGNLFLYGTGSFRKSPGGGRSANMKFKKGVEVFTEEDEEGVGSVERVVIDPVDREITHLVVKKGVLFTENRLIPVELISRTSDERVLLKKSADDLGSLQEFEETHYIQALDGGRLK
jgi:uncharacterized protein YrrD